MGGGVMPKLIVINEEVTACRECRFTEEIVYGNWVCLQRDGAPPIPDASTIPSWCPLPDAPVPVEKRCGTCRWWEQIEARPDVGTCTTPLPDWVATYRVSRLTRGTNVTDCSAWAAKEEK